MKITPSILRSSIKSIAILGIAILSLTGCKDGEDPDPREAFNGTFETEDFDVLLSVSSSTDDTLFAVTTNPEIEFDIDDDLQTDEMEMVLNEFIKEVMEQTLGTLASASFLINFDEYPKVEISGGEFTLDDFEFSSTVTGGMSAQYFVCDVAGEGELVGDEITFEFVINLYYTPALYYSFEGTAVATRN